MMVTGECAHHSAILGHTLLMKWLNTHSNFYTQYFSLLFDGLLNIFKVGEHMKYSHCSPESQHFYWVLSFCREHLIARYPYFHTNYHTECFPVYESPAAIESTTNQNTQTGEGTQMGSLRANVLTKKFSEKCRENQCFKAETRNPTSGESGKPTDWTEVI